MKVRASSDPVATHCSGFIDLVNKTPPHGNRGEAAVLGQAVHACISSQLQTGEKDLEPVLQLIRNGGLPETAEKEARIMVATATRIIEEVGPHMPGEWEIEAPVGDDVFTGRADLLAWDGSRLSILDWKSGRVERDYIPQILGYAGRACLSKGIEPTEFYLILADVRSGEFDARMFTPATVQAHMVHLRLQREEAIHSPAYTTGGHCGACSCASICPAFAQEVKALALAAGADFPNWQDVTGAELRKIIALISVFDRFKATFKRGLVCKLAEGDIDCGAGMTLTLETRTTRELDVSKTLPILEKEGFPDEVIMEATKLSLAPLVEYIRTQAQPRRKKMEQEDFVSRLDSAGALIVTRGAPFAVEKRSENKSEKAENNL